MSKKTNELWKQFISTDHSSLLALVSYIKTMAEEAKSLPGDKLKSRGNYKDGIKRFPQTEGEIIANDITAAIGVYVANGEDIGEQLSEISEIACQLEIDTNKEVLWQDFFEKVDKLQAEGAL